MKRIGIVAIAAIALLAAQTQAAIWTYNSTDTFRYASATFDDSVAGTLTVTLKNTSPNDATDPLHILTAVFFDLNGGALTPVSALLPAGTSVYTYDKPTNTINYITVPGGNVAGEWDYKEGITTAPLGATRGIGSAGFGIFGQPSFPPPNPNLSGPISKDGKEYSVNGLQYGLAPGVDNPKTGNEHMFSNELVRNSTVFTFSGFSGDASTDISNVVFQYGTTIDDDSWFGPPVPEPASVVIWSVLGAGAAAGGLALRRRRAPVRAPWSEENRKAIFEVIEQGRA